MKEFNYNGAQFEYEPYPICYITDFLDEGEYEKLTNSFPDLSEFKMIESAGNKYSLGEINNSLQYYNFLKKNKDWDNFFKKIKTKKFTEEVLAVLKQHNIDLGIKKFDYIADVKADHKKFGIFKRKRTLRSRFEFSVMQANGGHILPHTDAAQKMITIVISMIKPGEWQDAWGGGTDVLLPKDRSKLFNHTNKQGKFEDMDKIKEFPFKPNQAVLFIKTYNSWHSVTPMTGPADALRKAVTINIERVA